MSNIVGTYNAVGRPAGVRQLTVGNSVVGLDDASGGIPNGATRAIVYIADDDIRWTDDGVDPSSTFGLIFGPNSTFSVFELNSAQQIQAFKAIRVTTDAELNIAYYKA